MNHKFETDAETQIRNLSFTHIREIMTIDDTFQCFFYEFECMQGAWSVRELKRQIASDLYFRAGISKKPMILLEQIKETVKDPFTFKFLGLNGKLVIEKSDIEIALLDHLQ